MSRLRESIPVHARHHIAVGIAAQLSEASRGPDEVPFRVSLDNDILHFARENGLRIAVDAVLGARDGLRVEELGQLDLPGPDIVLIHCSGTSDQAWRYIAVSGTHVSLTPTSDAQIGLVEAITPADLVLIAASNLGNLPQNSALERLSTELTAQMYIQCLSLVAPRKVKDK